MRRAVLAAIRIYQRHLSPHKGFSCAYREHTGRASCSALGYRAVRRYGVIAGFALIRQRTYLCGVVHRRHRPPLARLRAERGVCDVSCDLPCHGGCDHSGTCDFGHVLSSIFDFLGGCDCGGCNWPSRSYKDDAAEKYVYIAPNTKLRRNGGASKRPPPREG
ncbi:MAG: membrane protein insertion efficiency factor YidD [Paucibacter sp.]|nr:membrane protein insertion efficiency factor YidD [Roseateles sp.]